uniref:Uncharacterized protein n=1 Tax=Rhodnius prolixus TaxID=13249 RepID=T1I013_RHOPR
MNRKKGIKEKRYKGLKFGRFAKPPKFNGLYLINYYNNSLQRIPVIELTFLYNSVKNSLKPDEQEKRYKGLKFEGFENLQNLTVYISLTINYKTVELTPVIEQTFVYNLVKNSLKSDEQEKRYKGLKFEGFENLQNLTVYISLTINYKTVELTPVIEQTFVYNLVKNSLKSDEQEKRYKGLKFEGFENLQNLTVYISLTINYKTVELTPVIEQTFVYNLVKNSLKSDEQEKRYKGLKFEGFENLQNLTVYISLTINYKTVELTPVIEQTFVYNLVKNSLKSDEHKKRYKGLKFEGFENLQNLTVYISLTINNKTLELIPVIELIFLYNLVKNSLKSDEHEKRYKGLKFEGFVNLQNLTVYISLVLKSSSFCFPNIVLDFIANWQLLTPEISS